MLFEEYLRTISEIQKIRWTGMPDKTELELELISAKNVYVKTMEGRHTKYCVYLAVVHKACEKPILHKGDIILVEIPIKTMINAMWEVPMAMRNNTKPEVLKNDNLFLHFTRVKHNKMYIHNIERRQKQPEHDEYVSKYYRKDMLGI